MSSERWERTKEILEQALRLAPKERQAYLDAACGTDASLHIEVESLIASHEEAGTQFLGADASEVLQLATPRALASGTKLGPYEIIELLGTGGLGEVYRAKDTRLGRTVAIKILPSIFSAHGERLRRFEQEARSASALIHPNIVTIYDLGQDGSCHYIAMELVEGKTLRALLGSGPLPTRKTIEIAAQVADGLTKAHEVGITHRDLKPENLMLSDDGFVKILDFGLAKLASPRWERSDTSTTSLTSTGMVLGTAGYMSPEQAAGERLDFRSDQFSFGLVLYEMLTGKRAFQRVTVAETLVAILREQAEPIGSQNRDAPAPLCWAIERCLAKEPDKRYASTRDRTGARSHPRPLFGQARYGGGNPSNQSSRTEDRVCGAGEGNRCRQRTPVASGCAAGHGHRPGRYRQDAPRRAGGEWTGRALSGWHSFCSALPVKRSQLGRLRNRSDIRDTRGGRSITARNPSRKSTRSIMPLDAAPAGQFRTRSSGCTYRGRAPGHGT